MSIQDNLRKYRTSLPSFPKYLPVVEIPNTPKYEGILLGSVVVIKSAKSAKELQENGCFGVGREFQKQFINEKYYELHEGIENGPEPTIIGKNEPSQDLNLFLEEAFFLHHALKVLRIRDETGTVLNTEQLLQIFITKKQFFVKYYVTYHYFRAKNWVVKQGTNFGSDFLLYKLGPQYYHSKFTVKVRTPDDKFPSKQFLGWYRISETSKKECLVIDVISSENDNDPMRLLTNLSNFRVKVLTFKRFNLRRGSRVAGTSVS